MICFVIFQQVPQVNTSQIECEGQQDAQASLVGRPPIHMHQRNVALLSFLKLRLVDLFVNSALRRIVDEKAFSHPTVI